MSDEGGTWSSDVGQGWDAGFAVQGEVDFTKDPHRNEEWSDISEDESPAVYADISHSKEYHYHIIQPKGTELDSTSLTYESTIAVDASEGVPSLGAMPTASIFPFQEDLFWRQQPPGVVSESTEYPVASYPSALYQSVLWLERQEKKTCSLHDGGTTTAEEKKQSRNVFITEQTVTAETHKEDLSKNGCHQGSELEGKDTAPHTLADAANLQTLERTREGILLRKDLESEPELCSSRQKHNYVDTTSGASMSYREGQLESTVEYRHNGIMTSVEQGGSVVTVFPSSFEFLLDHCDKYETTIPLEPVALQQCGVNPVCKHLLQTKEIGVSSSETLPNRCDEKMLMADQHVLKEYGEENRLEIPGQGCTDINNSEVMQPSTANGIELSSETLPNRSDEKILMADQHVLKECGEENHPVIPSEGRTDLNTSEVMQPSTANGIGLSSCETRPNRSNEKILMADQHVLKECGEENHPVIPSEGRTDLNTSEVMQPSTANGIGLSSCETLPNRSNEKILMADQHVLKECGEENHPVIPGEGCTDINTSEVVQPPASALAEMDRVKIGGSKQLGMGLTGTLKKQKRKVGRPLKKKTLLKMAKLLEIAKWREDSKGTYVNEATDSSLKHLGNLNFPNEQSLPSTSSFPSEMKEYINKLSISPLPNTHSQVPNPHKPTSFVALSGNPNRHEDCTDHPKKCVQATHRKVKSHKTAARSRKRRRAEVLSISVVPQDPPVVPETVVAQESASHRQKSIRNTQKNKTDMTIEERREGNLEQSVGNQSSDTTKLQKSVHQPAVDDVSAVRESSKPLCKRSNAKEISKKKDSDIKESTDLKEKGNPTLIDSLSETAMPPQMHMTVGLPNKPGKKMSLRSRKGVPQAGLVLSSADPEMISPQPEPENTILIEEKNKKASKRSQAKSVTSKGRKAAKNDMADTQIKPELPHEVLDADELHVTMHKDTNHQEGSTVDAHEAEQISSGSEGLGVPMETQTSAQDLSKQGRSPKRKGKGKRKRKVTPKRSTKQNNPHDLPSVTNETELPETPTSLKLSDKEPKQNTEKICKKKKAVEDKRQDSMEQVDTNGPPLKKDAICSEEYTIQSLTISQPPLREKTTKKRKTTDYGENGLNLNNCNVEQMPNSASFTLNDLDHSIPQPKLAKLECNVEPTAKIQGCRNSKKASKKKRNNAKSLGAPQQVSTEDILINTETVTPITPVSLSTLTKQRKSQKKKLCDLKEENKLQPTFQDTAMDMMTSETSQASTPRKTKKIEIMVPKEKKVQSPIANSSFDFTEEEFHVPIIKVTPRSNVLLEMTKPKQSCRKMSKDTNSITTKAVKTARAKSKASQETQESVNTLSESPEIKPEAIAMPLLATKPVKKLSSKQRKSKSSLKQSVLEHAEGEDSSGDVTEKGKCTEIKLEQAEFALSAVGHPVGLQQSCTAQTEGSLLMVKRKPGRPFKKKTLFKMARILEIVKESESNSTGNCGITDYVEGLLKKPHQCQPPRVKKEKETKPVVTPARRSLRTVVFDRTEANLHSSPAVTMDTDQEEKTDVSSSVSNKQSLPEKFVTDTFTLDSDKTTVDGTDQQVPQAVTEVETTAVRARKRRRKRKALNPKKRKGGWTKFCQQLASGTATQEDVVLSSNEDGASVSNKSIDVSCKVTSVPVPYKEEKLEQAILHNSNTSMAVSGTPLQTPVAPVTELEKRSKLKITTLTQKKTGKRGAKGEKTCLVEDAGITLEVSTLPPNQEKDDAELRAVKSLNKVKRKRGHPYKKKTTVKSSKLMAAGQTISELTKSQIQEEGLHFPQEVTKENPVECKQSVSVKQSSKLRRSLRGLSSAPLSTVVQEQSQPTQNLYGTTLSSKSFVVETKTQKLRNVFLSEKEMEGGEPSLEKHDNLTLPHPDGQQAVPTPGPSQQKKTSKRPKRKVSSRTSRMVESAEITDPKINSDASLTVAFSTSESQSTSVDHENSLKKSKVAIEEPAKEGVLAPVQPKMKIGKEEKAQSNTLLEASKNQSSDANSEEVNGEITSFPAENSQNVIQSLDKTLQPPKAVPAIPEEQVMSAVSSDTVEISTDCLDSDVGCEPDLAPSSSVDSEITSMAKDLSLPVSKSEEAKRLFVKKKGRRRKVMGWDPRKKSKRKENHNAVHVIEQPVMQNVEATVMKEEMDNFAHSSQSDGTEPHDEVLNVTEPQEDSEKECQPTDGGTSVATGNVLVHSGCQTSLSLDMLSLSQKEVEKVDGCTQYSEEECREQEIMSKLRAGQNVRQQSAKKTRTSIMCRFCGRSFRHISAHTVHLRLHTGERPYQCQHCGKRFAQLSNLKSHRKVHTVPELLQCPCCSQRFSKREKLITHFKVHLLNTDHVHSDGKTSKATASKSAGLTNSLYGVFNCSVCGKDLPSEQKLHIHKRTHKGERLSCKDCGKTFRKPSSLSAHERVHWPLKPYACSVCGKGFSKLQALKAHSLEHTGETPFFCSHCGYACSDLATLRAHQVSRICSTKKQDNIEGFLVQMGVDGQVNTPSLFKCHLCKKLLNHWCQYTLHLQTHTKAHPYLCDTCGQSYDRDSDIRVHCRDCCKSSGEEKACSGSLTDIWNNLETEEISQISQGPDSPEHMDEPCLILNDQACLSSDHSPVHPDMPGEDLSQSENPDPVSPCVKDVDSAHLWNSQPASPTPSNVSILSSHPSLDCYIVSSIRARTKTSHKRFECQHCGQTFRLSSILRAHLQTHFSGNKYTCGLCGRVFQRWHKLWLHQRLHQEKGRAFSCSDCNVQFRFLGLYREHLQVHAEQRPYACPLCPETFISEESLNAHQCENHRPRRTLKCEVCGKGFSSLRNWVKHSLLHNGRSSHSCLLCDQSFANNHALQHHLKSHNNDLSFPTSEIPSEPLLFPHQCWRCNASFSTGELLYAHQICHAVGGKPPARPRDAPTAHRISKDVIQTVPPPTVPERSVLEPPGSEQVPVPQISDENLFVYAHPDSLYVVPEHSPPPPHPSHSSSQANHLTSLQQIGALDEEVNLQDTANTSQNAPSNGQTISSSLNEDGNLPQTSSQQGISELLSQSASSPTPASSSASGLQDEPTLSLKVQHTLPPRHTKSKDAVKSFSITVQLQDTGGFECADCNISLSSVAQLHKHYLKHAKGVLTKIHI